MLPFWRGNGVLSAMYMIVLWRFTLGHGEDLGSPGFRPESSRQCGSPVHRTRMHVRILTQYALKNKMFCKGVRIGIRLGNQSPAPITQPGEQLQRHGTRW